MYVELENKTVLLINGKVYDSVKYIRDDKYFGTSAGNKVTIVNDDLRKRLKEPIVDYNGIVPQGSSIYLANNIPIDINTIRKVYNIKRKPEDADYVVFAPVEHTKTLWAHNHKFYVDNNVIIDARYPNSEFQQAVDGYGLKGYYMTENEFGEYLYTINDTKDFVSRYINKSYGKPVVLHTQLDLETGEQLTVDILNLTRRLGAVNHNNSDAEKNFILNIQALNNYNWRKYKGTIGIVFRSLNYERNSIYRYIANRLRSQNKTVQDVLGCRGYYSFVGSEDFELAQNYIIQILGINQFPMFVSTSSLVDKLSEYGIELQCFQALFGVVAKINKKEYVGKAN